MTSNLVRFGITVTALMIIVSSILVVRAQFGAASAGLSAATTTEQASVLDKVSASGSGQQSPVGSEHFLPSVSPVFEPLLLLLLGSVLLSIGSAIKLLTTRKLRQR